MNSMKQFKSNFSKSKNRYCSICDRAKTFKNTSVVEKYFIEIKPLDSNEIKFFSYNNYVYALKIYSLFMGSVHPTYIALMDINYKIIKSYNKGV